MAISKSKNGKWSVQIDRKGLKRVRRSFDSRKEAELFEREYLFNQRQAKAKIHDPRTLVELVDVWYQAHGINLANPEKLYNAMTEAAIRMGNPIAQALTPEIFLKYRFNRTQTDKKTISKKTMNNIHGYISAMYNLLKKLKMIDYDNPLADVDKLRIQEQQMTYLTIEQINHLLDSISSKCDNESTWWVANICLRTGARWGEAEQLVKKQLHNGRITFINTKSKKVRTIPIDSVFYKELVTMAKGKDPEDRLFTNCIGSFRRAMKRTGTTLPKGQMTHVLRHSFASHFMINNGNILTLQQILGHADIKMTMRYAHLAPNHFIDAVRLNPIMVGYSDELADIGGKVAVK